MHQIKKSVLSHKKNGKFELKLIQINSNSTLKTFWLVTITELPLSATVTERYLTLPNATVTCVASVTSVALTF